MLSTGRRLDQSSDSDYYGHIAQQPTANSAMNQAQAISVLDLSEPARLNLDEAAAQFRQATQQCGFLFVKYASHQHSIVEALRRVQRQFFDQPLTDKQAIAIDLNNRGYLGMGEALMSGASKTDQKEVFFWGRELADDDPDLLAGAPLCGANQWPALAGFRQAVLSYAEFIGGIGELVLQIIATSLGCDRNFFKPYFERSMLRGQLLRYPPTEPLPDQFGVAPHSDFGCITLLSQETNGLEVQFPDGQWVAAAPQDLTLVVNIGDLLERWSNHRLPSTRHRVRNTSADPRFSIAMFYDPSPLATVDPQVLLPNETPRYEPIGAAEYILSRNRQSFAHYKR